MEKYSTWLLYYIREYEKAFGQENCSFLTSEQEKEANQDDSVSINCLSP